MPPIPTAHHGSSVCLPLHRRRTRQCLGNPAGSAGAGSRRPEAAAHRKAAHRVQAAVRKDLGTFEHDRVPLALRQQLDELANAGFLDRGVNVLAFGLPGTGKTHAMCAVGHRLVESGRSVLFAPAYRLVQDLLAAKRDLALPIASLRNVTEKSALEAVH